MTQPIALVTGGNRGIGLAIAQALTREGASVVVTYRSGTPPAGFNSVLMDVTSTESVEQGFAEIEEKYGTPEIIVANAGITRDALVMRMSDQDFSEVLDANLIGAFSRCSSCYTGTLEIETWSHNFPWFSRRKSWFCRT
ncbi:MAG: SDR family NAD(P)-dependent oxidoreductase, partial [Actinomycetota bacterium]